MFIVSVLIIVIWLQISHLATRIATLGKIGEFQPSVEDWTQYAKHLEFFFAANAITTAEKKRAIFLAVVGPTTYELLRSMLAPNKPGEVAFNEMVKVLSDHYSPKPSEIVSRFKFYNRSRKPLQQATTVLRTYSGEQLSVCGCMNVEVVYGHQHLTLPLLVTKGNGPSLLGRDWLSQLKLNWREINTLMGVKLDEILAQHKEVFQESLGTL